MAYSVTFVHEITENADEAVECGVRLKGEITAFTDFVDPGVFLYLVDPVTHRQIYQSVCTPCDYEQWNYQQPGTLSFVRQKSFDLPFATAELASSAVAVVMTSLQNLCNAFSLSQQYNTPVTTIITENV